MEKQKTQDEVDILDFVITIFQNKWKIILVISLAVIGMYLSQMFQKPTITKFKASTEIRPISTFEETEYSTFNFYVSKITKFDMAKAKKDSFSVQGTTDEKNKIDFNETLRYIDRLYLNDLFIEKLNERKFLKKSIKKFNLVKKEKFDNIRDYDEATTKIANLIKISSSNSKKSDNLDWKIDYKTIDKKKWENFLRFLEKSVNEEVQKYVHDTFEKLILNRKQLKTFEIEDIDTEISGAIESYDIRMKNRVAFLKEQAEIARKLNIIRTRNLMIDSQNLSTSNESVIITSLQSEIPYYMKGYEMIEKEIDLIENRVNKSAFIDELYDLQKKKNILISNKDIERIEEIFENTPIVKPGSFYAARIMSESTKYVKEKNGSSLKLKLILAGIFGAVFSIFYVYVASAIKKRM